MNFRKALLSLTACAATTAAWGVAPGEIRWHNEASDTTKIANLLQTAASNESSTPQQRITYIAHALTGTPYESGTLEGLPERLTIDMSQFDCTTFVDIVLAIAKTSCEKRLTWHDVAHNLENMRYRNGRVNGYASRLHYISDWAIDNSQRGNIVEITADLAGASHEIKTLDFMSTHRDKYPALEDQAEFDRLKNNEIGYRSHRYPIVKTSRISKATLAGLREGDMVALTTKLAGLDVSHVGFITIVDGAPHLLHASSSAGQVVIDRRTLTDYLKRAKNVTGIRVFRLKD